MKTVLSVLGALLAITGVVWVLQGAGWLGGSFMTGERQWLVIGAVCIVAGIAALLCGNRSTRSPSPGAPRRRLAKMCIRV